MTGPAPFRDDWEKARTLAAEAEARRTETWSKLTDYVRAHPEQEPTLRRLLLAWAEPYPADQRQEAADWLLSKMNAEHEQLLAGQRGQEDDRG